MKRIYISVSNDMATDQRVQRVCTMLAERGYVVSCTGRLKVDSPAFGPVNYRVRRMRMVFQKGPLFYVCFNLRLFLRLLMVQRPDLYIANDLDTLPASFLASGIRRRPLLYDSHELFTEVPELVGRPFVKSIWCRIERMILPRLRCAITVSPSIADIYEEKYGVPFVVVRNVPMLKERKDLDKKDLDKKDHGIVIYQGALNLGRGLELMIRTMDLLEDWRFLIAGKGDVEAALRKQVSDSGLEERVVFLGRLSPAELEGETAKASVGISLEEDLGLNYRYALPNKLFDYIQAGIPVVCADLPEMAKIVKSYRIGEVLEERDPEVLAGLIRKVDRKASTGGYREGLEKAARDLCWEKERAKYLSVLETCIIGKK